MRIRTRHIILPVLILVTLFILYATIGRVAEEPFTDNTEGLALPMDMPIQNAPEIGFDTTHIDLGIISHDKETRKEITLYNHGGSTLKIDDVRSSCTQCTIGYFENGKNHIAPGMSSTMILAVSPAGIHGFHSQKTLTLSSNDPRHPQTILTVEAQIDPEYIIAPEYFDFGEITKGTPAQASVLMQNRTDTCVTVLSVSLSPDKTAQENTNSIIFSVEPVKESAWKESKRKEYRITATLKPDMRSGSFEMPVFIHTDLKRFATHRILAKGKIFAPYTVDLGKTASELHLRDGTTETITLRSDTPSHLSNLRSEQDFFVVQQQSGNQKKHDLQCTVSKDSKRGMHKDYLLFDIKVENVIYTERIPVTVYAYGITSNP
ncbi:MAG: DUF1573 domain-containing protein, partial [Candidatus Hydrogenedentes bacterium]|nr:DUF1573 domain-containing protein [Candidatus Hydrogenedentota bacterium]